MAADKGYPYRPKAPEVSKEHPLPEVFFENNTERFWLRVNGRYIGLKSKNLKLHLRSFGLCEANMRNRGKGSFTDFETVELDAQTHNLIDYAGSLAGHQIGIFSDGKRKYLVTDEPQGIWDPVPKKSAVPKFFLEFVQELLPGEQWSHFCHWLAIALRALRAKDFRPGQALVLAGPAQCGKSLLQYIITQVLGGRAANPFPYMSGEVTFTYSLAGAEHWKIEDPKTSPDVRTRREFGVKIKECANTEDFNVHKKTKDAQDLPLFRRITISVNDEPENLSVVPPMEESIADKVSLFKCEPVVDALKAFVVDTPALNGFGDLIPAGGQDRGAIKQKVKEEAPLIRAWLLRTFQSVPADWWDQRCGIRAFHHFELMNALTSLAPESRLLQIIDQSCFDSDNPTPLCGQMMKLETEVRNSQYGYAVNSILRFGGAFGTYLGRLAKSQPDRVKKSVKNGYTHWIITIPPKTQHKEEAA